ncbi:unnamed protein product [Thlaspi arvense]|uniref:Bet v I/Major latex protein domain-containing protein n=1 Tax=Thlaspi arvense TaxID=13288 RepID=A0AAU9SFA5_THLAR|nr:unnamed protein product [Thlaspi arvense]
MAEAATTEASSLVGTLETEVEIKASAGQFHHMFAGRPHHVSKASPGTVQGCEIDDGDWGKVGSIIFWNYVTPKHGEPGSVVHWHFEYEKITEEVAHPETLLQLAVELSKEIDEHLVSEE